MKKIILRQFYSNSKSFFKNSQQGSAGNRFNGICHVKVQTISYPKIYVTGFLGEVSLNNSTSTLCIDEPFFDSFIQFRLGFWYLQKNLRFKTSIITTIILLHNKDFFLAKLLAHKSKLHYTSAAFIIYTVQVKLIKYLQNLADYF